MDQDQAAAINRTVIGTGRLGLLKTGGRFFHVRPVSYKTSRPPSLRGRYGMGAAARSYRARPAAIAGGSMPATNSWAPLATDADVQQKTKVRRVDPAFPSLGAEATNRAGPFMPRQDSFGEQFGTDPPRERWAGFGAAS